MGEIVHTHTHTNTSVTSCLIHLNINTNNHKQRQHPPVSLIGFMDHVPPPQEGVPSPDGIVNPGNGFDFTRLGIRVPTLAISAHIPKNTVVHEPEAIGKPNATSQFESTSIIATTNRILGIGDNMTSRDAWAATFDYLLTEEARADCPVSLPVVQPAQPYEFAQQRSKKLNDHMDIQVSFYCKHNYPSLPLAECRESRVINQGTASDFIIEEAKKFLHLKQNNGRVGEEFALN
jgi:hypothetical protein